MTTRHAANLPVSKGVTAAPTNGNARDPHVTPACGVQSPPSYYMAGSGQIHSADPDHEASGPRW